MKIKRCVIQRKLKFKDQKHGLEATQLENEIIYLENNNFNVHSLKENHRELIKIDKSTLKIQQRIKSEKHNVFTEEVKKIALIAINHKTMIRLIDSTETYANGMCKRFSM